MKHFIRRTVAKAAILRAEKKVPIKSWGGPRQIIQFKTHHGQSHALKGGRRGSLFHQMTFCSQDLEFILVLLLQDFK